MASKIKNPKTRPAFEPTEYLKVGWYKLGPKPDPVKRSVVRYVYIDEMYMNEETDTNFLADLFMALGIKFQKRNEDGEYIEDEFYYQPNLVFTAESYEKFDRWNLRLPASKVKSIGGQFARETDDPSRTGTGNHTGTIGSNPEVNPNIQVAIKDPLIKYRKTVESGCRKAIKVIANVADEWCGVFQTEPTYNHAIGVTKLNFWLQDAVDVSPYIFAAGGEDDFNKDLFERMKNNATIYDPSLHFDNIDPKKNGFSILDIDTTDYYNGKVKAVEDDDGDVTGSIPVNGLTHLIITNDLNTLKAAMKRILSHCKIVIHGNSECTDECVEALYDPKVPVLAFKFTGSSADFLVDTMQSVDIMLRKKRMNPDEKVDLPFPSADKVRIYNANNQSKEYRPENWLYPFDREDIDSCESLNDFMEDFPDLFNPSSVLAIDILNINENRLREQVEKTIVFAIDDTEDLDDDAHLIEKFEGKDVRVMNWNGMEARAEEQFSEELAEDRIKNNKKKLLTGYYHIKGEYSKTKFVFLSDKYMNKDPQFLENAFAALGISDVFKGSIATTPNLMFAVESTGNYKDWNMRLPDSKIDKLCGKDHIYDNNTLDTNGNVVLIKSEKNIIHHYPPLRHYQGVIESNCKRLLKGTAQACLQAGAIFKCNAYFDHFDGKDQITQWIQSTETQVPILGICGRGTYKKNIYDHLKFIAKEVDDDELRNDDQLYLEIDPSAFYSGETRPWLHPELGKIENSIPHNNMTHLILTNDIHRLEAELDKLIPVGLLLIHGAVSAAKYFSEAIHRAQPIFIFKHTGSAADLACETLDFIDNAKRKKVDKNQPFDYNLTAHSKRPPYGWLWPFDESDVEICRLLNILVENFPTRYDKNSVLQIDMFNTSEEELQDQLTKTMSAVFEGGGELGGQASEDTRLTYAWRLRYRLFYNSNIQKIRADAFRMIIIIFTFFSVTVAVLYSYAISCKVPDNTLSSSSSISTLSRLNLIIPLIITVLRGIYAFLNPLVKATILKLAATKVESEIYMYRTKTCHYSVRKISSSSNVVQKKNKKGGEDRKDNANKQYTLSNPRKIFSAALDTIWTDLLASDISKGGLVNAPSNADPLKDINDRICKEIDAQNYYLGVIGLGGKKNKQDDEDSEENLKSLNQKRNKALYEKLNNQTSVTRGANKKTNIFGDDDQIRSSKDFTVKNNRNNGNRFNSMSGGTATNTESSESENARIRSIEHSMGAVLSSPTDNLTTNPMLDVELGYMAVKTSKPSDDNTQNVAKYIPVDDGLSVITADEYVRIRLIPMLSEYSQKAPVFNKHISLVTSIVILLSIASAIFSTVDLTTFIPLAIAFGEALTAWQTHNALDIRLQQTNGAMNQLNKLLIWWKSLNMIEKRSATNKEYLVERTEDAILGQVAVFNSRRDTFDEDNGDEDRKDK